MNRRGFIGSLLGLAASATLPVKAIEFIERTATLPDAEFVAAASTDSSIIDLINARMEEAMKAMMQRIEHDIFHNGTQP